MSDESFETKDITSINVGVDDITSKLPRKIGRPKKFNFPKSSNPRTKRKYNHCLELTCSKCKGHDVYTLLKVFILYILYLIIKIIIIEFIF